MNSRTISVVITQDIKDQIDELAKKKNISRNALIRLVLSEYIERNN